MFMPFYNIVSFLGLFVLMFIAWLFSSDKRKVNWRLIIWGVSLQIIFALIIFVFPPGAKIFLRINDIAVKIMDSATAGAEFVFGPLAVSPGKEGSLGFILAFQGLPTIIFFSALMAILYYFGIMQWIITFFARIFTRLLNISGAESLCAASNIFVGVESSLTVKPYLEKMTDSELTTILTAGMATVASNVLALYVFSLQAQLPTIAAHLISASFLSAPAALIMSKLIMPETGTPETLGQNIELIHTRENNVIVAVINGSNSAVKLIVGIVALLIAVLGLVALTDMIVIGLGEKINALVGIGIDWSLKSLLGYLFYPIALVLGIPAADALTAAKIIGERIIVTEVTSYQDLAAAMTAGAFTSSRSPVICSYALCGFAHIASAAIFIGGISAVARKQQTP